MTLARARRHPSEPPLTVFISSVMDEALLPWRERAVAVLERFASPWAFEHVPASSGTPQERYLEKVRTADFVVWLVGSETTAPVEAEIRAALAAGRRLLVFRLPADVRASRTQDLLHLAGQSAKWQDVADLEDLVSAIEMSMRDEIVRAVRQQRQQQDARPRAMLDLADPVDQATQGWLEWLHLSARVMGTMALHNARLHAVVGSHRVRLMWTGARDEIDLRPDLPMTIPLVIRASESHPEAPQYVPLPVHQTLVTDMTFLKDRRASKDLAPGLHRVTIELVSDEVRLTEEFFLEIAPSNARRPLLLWKGPFGVASEPRPLLKLMPWQAVLPLVEMPIDSLRLKREVRLDHDGWRRSFVPYEGRQPGLEGVDVSVRIHETRGLAEYRFSAIRCELVGSSVTPERAQDLAPPLLGEGLWKLCRFDFPDGYRMFKLTGVQRNTTVDVQVPWISPMDDVTALDHVASVARRQVAFLNRAATLVPRGSTRPVQEDSRSASAILLHAPELPVPAFGRALDYGGAGWHERSFVPALAGPVDSIGIGVRLFSDETAAAARVDERAQCRMAAAVPVKSAEPYPSTAPGESAGCLFTFVDGYRLLRATVRVGTAALEVQVPLAPAYQDGIAGEIVRDVMEAQMRKARRVLGGNRDAEAS